MKKVASKPAQVVSVGRSCHVGQGAHGRHVQQQDDGGNDR
jgi:hypothetical protein